MLTLWRNKLRASDRPQRIFEAVREVIDATTILVGKARRALDSTVLDDGVTRQDAIMQLVAHIRRVRRLVPAARALVLVAHGYDNDAGKPACAWNDRADIDRVVTELVGDAHTILASTVSTSMRGWCTAGPRSRAFSMTSPNGWCGSVSPA